MTDDLRAWGWEPGMYGDRFCFDCKRRLNWAGRYAYRCYPCALHARDEAQRARNEDAYSFWLGRDAA